MKKFLSITLLLAISQYATGTTLFDTFIKNSGPRLCSRVLEDTNLASDDKLTEDIAKQQIEFLQQTEQDGKNLGVPEKIINAQKLMTLLQMHCVLELQRTTDDDAAKLLKDFIAANKGAVTQEGIDFYNSQQQPEVVAL